MRSNFKDSLFFLVVLTMLQGETSRDWPAYGTVRYSEEVCNRNGPIPMTWEVVSLESND